MSKDFPNSREQLTPEQRRERDAQRRADAVEALADYEKAQKAFHANRERLRAERLAREAQAEAAKQTVKAGKE